MSQGDPADRRQQRRVIASFPVRFGLEGRMCDGMIIDLSDGGLQIRASGSFAAGMLVDLFVQFPRRRLRLRARVVWVRGEPPVMRLAYIQPDRSLMAAYEQWVEEAGPATSAPKAEAAGAGAPAPDAAPRPSPAAPIREPSGPVEKHVETGRGNQYDLRIEKDDSGWRLLIYSSPRSFPTPLPEVDASFPDFTAADAALKEFLRTH